jgi:aminoglycoside 6'-N-acetyltransferase I
MEIRPIRLEEYPTWLNFRNLLWPDSDLDELKAEQDEIIEDVENQTALVAVLPGGELAGFIEVSLRKWAEGCSTHPVGYIEGWFVAEPHRRTGVGRKLVEAAETWAMSKGCTEMGSDAETWNEVSFQAHKALGYTDVMRLVCFSKILAHTKSGI